MRCTFVPLTRQKRPEGRLLEVGDRLSLAAQQEALPYKYVSVEGPVVAIEPSNPSELEAMAIRYLGEEQGKAYAAQSSGENVTVRMAPERWLTVDYAKA